MRILQVNKFWRPQGGADRYAIWLAQALIERGHEVSVLSTAHPDNVDLDVPTRYISNIETERMNPLAAPRTVGRMLWSFEAQRALEDLIRETRPQVAHVHNLYTQLSPSILPVFKRYGIPVVCTVHDYGMLSGNYSLFDRFGIDTVGSWGSVIKRRGVKDSYVASAIAATVFGLHKGLRVYKRGIDKLIFTTEFVQRLFDAKGWDVSSSTIVPYVVPLTEEAQLPQEDEGYFLFVGRLHKTKGVDVLIEAARETGLPVKIVGDGPDAKQLKEQAASITNIEFLGRRSYAEMLTLTRKARACVVPSIWWEPFGMVAIEPQGLGTPVIASKTGGLQNLVVHGQTGLLVNPEDKDQLAQAMQYLNDDPEKAKKMGALGKRGFESKYGIDEHLSRLESIYTGMIQR